MTSNNMKSKLNFQRLTDGKYVVFNNGNSVGTIEKSVDGWWRVVIFPYTTLACRKFATAKRHFKTYIESSLVWKHEES